MEENLHFPVSPPDEAELPLKPGWHDAILLSSEPLQWREFLLEHESFDLTEVRIMIDTVSTVTSRTRL